MKTIKRSAAVLLGMELLYLAASAAWLISGQGFALNKTPLASVGSGNSLPTEALGMLLLVLAGAGAWITVRILRGAREASAKWASIAMTAVSLLVALVIVGDMRLLAILGNLPLLLMISVGAVPGTLPNAEQLGLADLVHQLLLFLLAGMWTVLALRLTHQAPAHSDRTTTGMISRFVLKHRVAITVVAAAIPATYAVTRFFWAAGIPLGINSEDVLQLLAGGGANSALGLASMATVGVLLTLGLLQRWGRQWPSWLPWIGGKPVPVGLAVVPAGVIAMILIPAGTDMFRLAFAPHGDNGIPPLSWDNWAVLGPNLLWHVWGVGLAAAAYGYWLMRRDQRSDEEIGRINMIDSEKG